MKGGEEERRLVGMDERTGIGLQTFCVRGDDGGSHLFVDGDNGVFRQIIAETVSVLLALIGRR